MLKRLPSSVINKPSFRGSEANDDECNGSLLADDCSIREEYGNESLFTLFVCNGALGHS